MRNERNIILLSILSLSLILSLCFCENGELAELRRQMRELRVERFKYYDIVKLQEQWDETTHQLDRKVSIIHSIKESQYSVEIFQAVDGVIPNPIRVKEFFLSQNTLNLTLLFPTKESISQFKNNLEKTKSFLRIEYFPDETQTTTGPFLYVIVCDYYKSPINVKNKNSFATTDKRDRAALFYDKYHRDNNDLSAIDKLKRRIQEMKLSLKRAKIGKNKKSQIRKDIQAKQLVLLKLEEILPGKIEPNQVIKEIQSIARNSKIRIQKLLPKYPVEKKIYFEYPISLEFTGQYPALVHFLKRLETQKRLFYIRHIYITFTMEKPHQAKIEGYLTVSTFFTHLEN